MCKGVCNMHNSELYSDLFNLEKYSNIWLLFLASILLYNIKEKHERNSLFTFFLTYLPRLNKRLHTRIEQMTFVSNL